MNTKRSTGIADRPWAGTVRAYDLFKELTIALTVVGLVILGLSFTLGSPDEPSVTLKGWAAAAPTDFVTTATAELGGTSETALYGPPYTHTEGATQTIGPFDPQSLSGVRLPIDTANDFVITPLGEIGSAPAAVATWNRATDQQRSDWTSAYTDALGQAPESDPTQIPNGDFGPVPALTGALLAAAQAGSLDGVLQAQGEFYNLDYTRPILFLGDGS
ncbi:hypothetical protein [Cryobacterium sp. MLB-32]|uniref:hypothetical protein n=1 Tax=Cryobacterium sp. MLB-32 TaxID=1529318 RepID=UPI0006913038|nr:hypothetical protein [Cryobacterium sp. MLB-32]